MSVSVKGDFVRTLLVMGFYAASLSAMPYQSATAEETAANSTKLYNVPAGALGSALSSFAGKAGVTLSFDPSLTQNKISSPVNGTYDLNTGFKTILKGTGLTAVPDGRGGYYLEKLPDIKGDSNLPLDIKLEEVSVRAKRFYEVGPMPGLGLTKEEIPGNVQSLTAQDIKDAHALSIADLMNSKLQSVNVNDYQGNPFQMDVTYRGFTAGPQIGTPQGLSVFMDGIRVNEPFGDVVNWDMIPMNALSGFDVFPGSNPIFGLGTLGGAVSMKTKSGFDSVGVNAEVLTGSYGRKQLQASGGWNNGTVGVFGAGNFFLEDGWRENSPSKVNQVFGKGSYRGDKLDVNLSTLYVWNDLVGNGLIPSEMYKENRNGVFTSPDTTNNKLLQFQLSGNYFVNDNFNISAQVYRRNSKRNQVGADVYTEYGSQTVRRNLATGEVFTCLFNSSNPYKLPDYYVVDLPDDDFFQSPFVADLVSQDPSNIVPNFNLLPAGSFNQALPADFLNQALDSYARQKNFIQTNIFAPQGAPNNPPVTDGPVTSYSNGNSSFSFEAQVNLSALRQNDPIANVSQAYSSFYYYTPDTAAAGDPTPGDGVGVKHIVYFLPPTNAATCQGDANNTGLVVNDPNTGNPLTVDGAAAVGGAQPGVVDGTPTAVLTNTDIDQISDGGSIQLNWNFEKHKFMVGASLDAPSAKYRSGQMLGLMDAQRNVYLSPDQIRDQYAAASEEISNNNFNGSQVTKSLYVSETWSPIETLHVTGAARYNATRGKNEIASRTYGFTVFDLSQYQAFPNYYDVCINGLNCPSTGYNVPDASNLLNAPEKEYFSYYSINPSLGMSWQAKPNLNIYSNWAQGTRTPSVIELGCAFDHTLVPGGSGPSGMIEKSLRDNRSCSLPSALSGDPYLPQIKAQTLDLGMRGKWGDNFEWNVDAYRTDLKDDIYLVTFPGNKSFFDSIGDTRRQGLEAGFTAKYGKTSLRLNYALTDATFQNSFMIESDNNSSAVEDMSGNYNYGRRIQVKPGDRMPGVPLHNLNATLRYEVTSNWQVSLTAIAHSGSYVRGNENNQHQQGVVTYYTDENGIQRARQPTTNPGSVDGYMTFNAQTSYRLSSEWTFGMRINNLLDKEYFSAGRLGVNPFSPSINGAIGPDGYNHNSGDWLSTNFVAPGAPRGVWVSLTYEFDPRK